MNRMLYGAEISHDQVANAKMETNVINLRRTRSYIVNGDRSLLDQSSDYDNMDSIRPFYSSDELSSHCTDYVSSSTTLSANSVSQLSDTKCITSGFIKKSFKRFRQNKLTAVASRFCKVFNKKEYITQFYGINSHVQPILGLVSVISVSESFAFDHKQDIKTNNSTTTTFLSKLKKKACKSCKENDLPPKTDTLSQSPRTTPYDLKTRNRTKVRNKGRRVGLRRIALVICALFLNAPTVRASDSIIDDNHASLEPFSADENAGDPLFEADEEPSIDVEVLINVQPPENSKNIIISIRFVAKTWILDVYVNVQWTSDQMSETYTVLSPRFDASVSTNDRANDILGQVLRLRTGAVIERIINQILMYKLILPPPGPNDREPSQSIRLTMNKPDENLFLLSKKNDKQLKTLLKRFRNRSFIRSTLKWSYEKLDLLSEELEEIIVDMLKNHKIYEEINYPPTGEASHNSILIQGISVPQLYTESVNPFITTGNRPLWLTSDPIIIEVTIMIPCEGEQFTILGMIRKFYDYLNNAGIAKRIIFQLKLLDCQVSKKKQTELVIVAGNGMCGPDQAPPVDADTCPPLILRYAYEHEEYNFWTLETFSHIVHFSASLLETLLVMYMGVLLLGYIFDVNVEADAEDRLYPEGFIDIDWEIFDVNMLLEDDIFNYNGINHNVNGISLSNNNQLYLDELDDYDVSSDDQD